MPNDNLLRIRDSRTGELIEQVPVLIKINKGWLIIDSDEARTIDYGPKFDKFYRIKVERLLSEGYKVPQYQPLYDYWQLTAFWLITDYWAVLTAFGPGDAGSHYSALPQHGGYPWEKSAYLAQITAWKEGGRYGTKEFLTPDEALAWLRELIED